MVEGDLPKAILIQLDIFIANATISACEKAAQWQLALELLAQVHTIRLQADAARIRTSSSGINGCPTAVESFIVTVRVAVVVVIVVIVISVFFPSLLLVSFLKL